MASEISRALGLEEDYEFEGTTYKLAPAHFEVKNQWEAWLKRRADLDLELSKRWLSPESYLERVRQLTADKTAGDYDFFGPVSHRAMQSWEGQIELAAIRLAEAKANGLDLDAARKLARHVQETNAEKFLELQRRLREMDDDPNAPARTQPGTPTASSPSAPSSSGSPGTCASGKSPA